jgi:hypothetical protein
MKVLLCGSHEWRDWTTIRFHLAMLPRGTKFIVGDGRGADHLAYTQARALGFEVKKFPAYWRRNGIFEPEAGLERDLRMLTTKPDLVVTFWDGESPGTRQTILEACRRGIRVEIIPPRCDARGALGPFWPQGNVVH